MASSSTSIVKRDDEIASLRARLSGLRARGERKAQELQKIAVAGATAYVFGNWRRTREAAGQAIPTIGGLDPLICWSAGLYVGGEFLGGRMGEVSQGAAEGLLCAYLYNRGNTATSTTTTTTGT